MKILLIRHPQTEALKNRIIYGRSESPLTPEGVASIAWAAEKLKAADLAAKEGDPAKELVNAVVVKFGRLDILVNNAGILNDATVSFMSDEQWTDTLNMDLTVPFKLIRAAAMNMARQRWGRIVNMASDAGRMGSANRSNYAAAKEGPVPPPTQSARASSRRTWSPTSRTNAARNSTVKSPAAASPSPKKSRPSSRSFARTTPTTSPAR